ncbi:MAG: MBL fold metallo-hydrolase [Clostridia bacterium]|nr:MBL fold metallo-hydrolase [Clostridia bacterium]
MNVVTIKTLWSLGELKQNTHIIADEDGCIIIDAGCSLEQIRTVCDKPVKAVLLTHGHFDHIQYIEEYDRLGIPIYASEKIVDFLLDADKNVSKWYTPKVYEIKNLVKLIDGDQLDIDSHHIDCYYTPGHSDDSMCYLIDNEHLFSGDTLFSVAVGRTDLTTGDKNVLICSLKKILNLNFKHLYTGHGRNSDKEEQMTNIPKWIDRLNIMSI